MPIGNRHIVWMDLEMTGLDPERERILEVAVLVTDSNLDVVAEGPSFAIHQDEGVLAAMDAWNQEHHHASGLVERVRASRIDERAAEELLLDFLRQHCEERTAPLAGNSIWQDRRFLARYLPRVERFLHHRIVDVSSLKELAYRWRAEIMERAPRKRETHRALDDIHESLEELRFYRRELFRL